MFRREAEALARAINELRAALAVGFRGAGDFGDAFSDERLRDDELRLTGRGLRIFKRCEECAEIVAINRLNAPLDRLETLRRIFALRGVRHRIECHVVGVVNEDQVVQFEMPGERCGLHRHALLHAAVARERDDVVVENRVLRRVEFRRRHFLRHCVADCIRDALAERAGRRLDARRLVEFRMPRRVGAEHAEIFHLPVVHARVAAEVQPRVEEHRAMSGAEDKAVAVQPFRLRRIVGERVAVEHRADFRAAERQAEMP